MITIRSFVLLVVVRSSRFLFGLIAVFTIHLLGFSGFTRFGGVSFRLLRFFCLIAMWLLLLCRPSICSARCLDLVGFILSSLSHRGIDFCSYWRVRNLLVLKRSFLDLLCLKLSLLFCPFESMCLFLIHYLFNSWFMILRCSSGFESLFYLLYSGSLSQNLLLDSLLHYNDLWLDFECEGNVLYCSSFDVWGWGSWQLTHRPDFCTWPFFWRKLGSWGRRGWVWVHFADCYISSWFFFE